jgi:transposase
VCGAWGVSGDVLPIASGCSGASLIRTAKANGLEPYAYLRHVFTELPKATSLVEVEALLPARIEPDALQSPSH